MKLFRNRVIYTVLISVVIVLGLGSRKYSNVLPTLVNIYIGDALWAIMIYLLFGFTFNRKSIKYIGIIAWVFCICIEFSQLYQAQWINEIRRTRVGGLILGYGFLWSDIIAYTAGIITASILEKIFITYDN